MTCAPPAPTIPAALTKYGVAAHAYNAYRVAGPTIAVHSHAARNRCRGHRSRSTPPTPATADPANAPWPPSKPGNCLRNYAAAPTTFREDVARANADSVEAARRLFAMHVLSDGRAAPPEVAIDRITTFTDSEMDTVDAITAALDLPGAAGIDRPWDKLHQRAALRAAGVSALRAVAVESSEDFRRAVAALISACPRFSSPRRGVNGHAVSVTDTEVDVETELGRRGDWSGLSLEPKVTAGWHPSGVPGLAGFVSVETVTDAAGGHRYLALFDKLPVFIARQGSVGVVSTTGDLFPSRPSAVVARRTLDRTAAALTALRVRSRVTHTQLWVTAETSEVNGRVGGHLNRLLRLTGGPNLVRAALAASLGADAEVPAIESTGYAAGVFLPFPSPEGTVGVRGVQGAAAQLPGVVGVDELAALGEPRAATGYRVVNVTVKASDGLGLDANLRGVVDGLAADPWLCELRARLANAWPSTAVKQLRVRR